MKIRLRVLFIVSWMWVLKSCNGNVSFIDEPSDDTTDIGRDHWFTCIVTGLQDDQILQWYKNDIRIFASEDLSKNKYSIQRKQGGSKIILWLTNVATTDGGRYQCVVVASESGEIIKRSRAAILVVQSVPGPQYPLCDIPSRNILVDSLVDIKCMSQNVNPPVSLKWMHQGEDLERLASISEHEENVSLVLSMKIKKEQDGALYTCEQTSTLVPNNISSCRVGPLNILYKPEIDIQYIQPILAGRETIIFCQTNANPPVTNYKWMFHPDVPPSDYILDNTKQVLKLVRPTIAQNGSNLTCIARNDIGETISTIRIYITKPKTNVETEKTTSDMPNFEDKNSIYLSLDVVIIIAAGVVIIVVLVVLVPVYHYCLCRNENITTLDYSEKTVTQPEVYYEAREGVILRHTIQDLSLIHI
ncbi:kin of IRRE-like protein 1 [Anneissia japonica]|uniref:kin of IRRE-like protein 1 n=1 Tax=Anneissia japonica TaxID=1529436 RepID=UPI0014257DF6|nr:kin of IRRE-like protein 1 [Anneissia japonica]